MEVDIFSKRGKPLPSILRYNLVEPLRQQIKYIINNIYEHNLISTESIDLIHHALCREHGLASLPHDSPYKDDLDNLLNNVLHCENVELVLDIIELIFRVAVNVCDEDDYRQNKLIPLIDELNDNRFKEHGFGYRFENRQIIRIDNTVIHQEITKPTIFLLNDNKKFKIANDIYMKAHELYKKGDNAEAIINFGKSLQTVIEIILNDNSISHDKAIGLANLFDLYLAHVVSEKTRQSFNVHIENIKTIAKVTFDIRNDHSHKNYETSDKLTRFMMNTVGSIIIFVIEISNN